MIEAPAGISTTRACAYPPRCHTSAHRYSPMVHHYNSPPAGPGVYVRRGMGTVLSTVRSLCTTRHGRAPVRGVVELEASLARVWWWWWLGGWGDCPAGLMHHRSGLMLRAGQLGPGLYEVCLPSTTQWYHLAGLPRPGQLGQGAQGAQGAPTAQIESNLCKQAPWGQGPQGAPEGVPGPRDLKMTPFGQKWEHLGPRFTALSFVSTQNRAQKGGPKGGPKGSKRGVLMRKRGFVGGTPRKGCFRPPFRDLVRSFATPCRDPQKGVGSEVLKTDPRNGVSCQKCSKVGLVGSGIWHFWCSRSI